MGAEPKTTADNNENSRRLDFDLQSFVNVGSWLSAQERPQTTSAYTQTAVAPVPARTTTTSQRVIVALLSLLVVLLCTNAYSYKENRALKKERSALQGRIGELENDLINTCWIKMGEELHSVCNAALVYFGLTCGGS